MATKPFKGVIDIDIRDSFQVEWALSFRMQPAEDVYVIKNTDPLTLDPSQPLKDGEKVKIVFQSGKPHQNGHAVFSTDSVDNRILSVAFRFGIFTGAMVSQRVFSKSGPTGRMYPFFVICRVLPPR